jgi:hypothetical protein
MGYFKKGEVKKEVEHSIGIALLDVAVNQLVNI